MTDALREDRRQPPKPRQQRLLSRPTVADRLGVFLPATPDDFRAAAMPRDVAQRPRARLHERPGRLAAERERHAPGTGRTPGTAIGERPSDPLNGRHG